MNQEQYPGPAPIGESGPELIHIPPGASIISAEKMKAALEEKLAYVQEVKHNPLSGLAVGRIVHYVLESDRSKGEHRPAIVVRDWSNSGASYPDGTVNLQVFTDGFNDGFREVHVFHLKNDEKHEFHTTPNTLWRTSVHYSENKEAGTWHWPEKV